MLRSATTTPRRRSAPSAGSAVPGSARLNVLTLCHEYPPIGGGAAAVCAALGRHYVKAGHAVTVLTMGYEDLPEYERDGGVEVYRVACGRRHKEMASVWESLRWAGRCTPLLWQLHYRMPFDVTHAHFIMPGGIAGSRMKRRYGVPLVITPHGSDVPGYNRERLKLAHVLAGPWWRTLCRGADRIVCPSASLLKLLRAAVSRAPATVIPNGFEMNRPDSPHKQRRILLCSRLVRRKGFHDFLAAIEDLELSGWQVDVVGDGPMRDELARLASRCKIPVRLHGWIDNQDPRLADLYARARIFALPSQWENFSIALLEAMSAGCAVITTDVAGNCEVVGDTACFVAPGDVAALRRAVCELAADAPRCAQLGRRAARRVYDNFEWKVIAARYLELLGEYAAKRDIRCN